MKPKIHVVGGGSNYISMLREFGFNVVGEDEQPDMLLFTGGADVSPALYFEQSHPLTRSHPERDVREASIYELALSNKIPMIGICRGAQFLHVMNGGKLYQHVDSHAIGKNHIAMDVETKEEYMVTSTHHQMMRYSTGSVVSVASESKHKYYMSGSEVKDHGSGMDIEAVWHEDSKCLCFQPHPELLVGADSTRIYFRKLLQRFYGV